MIAMNVLAIHANRVTIQPKDGSTLKGIMKIFQSKPTWYLMGGYGASVSIKGAP